MIYRRGNVWWYKFSFQSTIIRESTGLTSKDAARHAERKRHTELREGRAGVSQRKRVPLFNTAADEYLSNKKSEWATSTATGEAINIRHLKSFFAHHLLTDITAADVSQYRDQRLKEVAPKTIALELGALRALLRFHDFDSTWSGIRKKIKLAKAEKVGRVISKVEESALLVECQRSRSRSLYPAVVTALEAGMRLSEIRRLRWLQIDFQAGEVTVGKSKTDAGEGRVIPMSQRLYHVLSAWACNFPERKPAHAVFPSENVGQPKRENGERTVYNSDPMTPINSWKEAWEASKKRAGVQMRFHDLRHTAITRLLNAGVSHLVVGELAGWSAATTIRMAKEVYGHISRQARHEAIMLRERYTEKSLQEWSHNWSQSKHEENSRVH